MENKTDYQDNKPMLLKDVAIGEMKYRLYYTPNKTHETASYKNVIVEDVTTGNTITLPYSPTIYTAIANLLTGMVERDAIRREELDIENNQK